MVFTAYLEAVLAFLLLEYLLETYIDIRQHKRYADKSPPNEIAKLVTPETFTKSQEYGRDKSSFGFFHSFVSSAYELWFLYAGMLPFLWYMSDGVVTTYLGMEKDESSDSREIAVALGFVFLNSIIDLVKDTPWSIVRTFVIEEKHGFNKSTYKIFFMDLIKEFIVGTILSAIMMSVLIVILRRTGEYMWLYAWIAIVLFQVVIASVYPFYIMPLFNKFTPMEDGDLKTKIEELAGSLNFPLNDLMVMDGSSRSAHSNAFFCGFFKKRIVLYDTLIEQVDTTGIVAVLAHELGHWKRNHIKKQLVIMSLVMLILMYGFGVSMHNVEMFKSFGFYDERPVLIGLMIFMMTVRPVNHILTLGSNYISRKYEYEADQFATELGYDMEPPLVKLQAENLSSYNPDPWYSTYHYSHPTLTERIRAVRAIRAAKGKKAK